MKRLIISLIISVFIVGSASADSAVEQHIRKLFPNLTINRVSEAPIEGLYEVSSDNSILYFYPKGELLVFGEIWSKTGKNLTADKKAALATNSLKNIPLEKAVRIGTGKNTVIEFTDPDCPYCRKVSAYFQGKADITRYIFLFPLESIHPNSRVKAEYILCSSDPAAAYEEVMSGHMDATLPEPCKDPAIKEKLSDHKKIADVIGVTGTPTLVVNGNIVSGADFQKIEQILAGN